MTTPLVPSITDEQIAEIERGCYDACPYAVERLISRLRAAERDANRWRFVKDKQTFIWLVGDWFPPSDGIIDVDAAIDQAMQEHNQ